MYLLFFINFTQSWPWSQFLSVLIWPRPSVHPRGLNRLELLQGIADLLQALAAASLHHLDQLLPDLGQSKWVRKLIWTRLLRLEVLLGATVIGDDIVWLPVVPYGRYLTLLGPCVWFLLLLDANRLPHLQWFRCQIPRFHICSLIFMNDRPECHDSITICFFDWVKVG